MDSETRPADATPEEIAVPEPKPEVEVEIHPPNTPVVRGTGSSKWPLAVNGCKVPGYKGIYESRERPYLWYARAVHAGTRHYLGYYNDVDVAQKAVYCCEEHGKEKCHEMYPCVTRDDPLFARRPRPTPKQDHGVYASTSNPYRFIAQATHQGKRYYLGIHNSKSEALQAVMECEMYGPSSVVSQRNSAKKSSSSAKRKAGQDPNDNIYKNNYTDSALRRAKQAKFVPDVDVTARPKKSKDNSENESKSKPETKPKTKGSEKNVEIEFF